MEGILDKEIEIICYGCGRGEYPENTIEAIKHCQSVNPSWRIDLDLQITKDNEIVLFHDYNTLRRTGKDCNINELNLNEVQELNAGYYFGFGNYYPYRENPIKIPTLKEVFSIFEKAKFILDVHTNNLQAVDIIIEIIEKYVLPKQIIIVSHYDKVIQEFKKKRPNWTFGAATQEVKKTVFSSFLFLDFLFPLKSDVLLIPIKFNNLTLLNKRVLKHIKRRNKKIIVWQKEGKSNDDVVCIENKTDYLNLKQMGVDGIYTEFPKLFNTILNN